MADLTTEPVLAAEKTSPKELVLMVADVLPAELMLMIEEIVMNDLADGIIDKLLHNAFCNSNGAAKPWWTMNCKSEREKCRQLAPTRLCLGPHQHKHQRLRSECPIQPLESTVKQLFSNWKLINTVFERCRQRAAKSSCGDSERQQYIDIRLWIDATLEKVGKESLYRKDNLSSFIWVKDSCHNTQDSRAQRP